MRTAYPVLLALAVAYTADAGDPKPKQDAKAEAIAKEMKRLEGTWLCVLVGIDDEERRQPADDRGIRMVIRGDSYSLESEGNVFAKGAVKLDPTLKPKAIDLTPADGANKGKVFAGIYELTGEGKKQLATEESRWQVVTSAVNRILKMA